MNRRSNTPPIVAGCTSPFRSGNSGGDSAVLDAETIDFSARPRKARISAEAYSKVRYSTPSALVSHRHQRVSDRLALRRALDHFAPLSAGRASRGEKTPPGAVHRRPLQQAGEICGFDHRATEARIHSERCSRSHRLVRSSSMSSVWASFASTSSLHPFRRRKTSVAKKATRLLPSTKG